MGAEGLGRGGMVRYACSAVKQYVKRTGNRFGGLFAMVPDDGAVLFSGGRVLITTSASI